MGRLPPVTLKAKVWEIDDRVVAIAGYWMQNGAAVVFSDMAEDVDAAPLHIFREAKAFMGSLDAPAVCVATPGSEKFLRLLGWSHRETSESGEIYECS